MPEINVDSNWLDNSQESISVDVNNEIKRYSDMVEMLAWERLNREEI